MNTHNSENDAVVNSTPIGIVVQGKVIGFDTAIAWLVGSITNEVVRQLGDRIRPMNPTAESPAPTDAQINQATVAKVTRKPAKLDPNYCDVFPDPFYTIDEVAKAYKCSTHTIRRMVKRGELPPIRGATKRFIGWELRAVAISGKLWSDLKTQV